MLELPRQPRSEPPRRSCGLLPSGNIGYPDLWCRIITVAALLLSPATLRAQDGANLQAPLLDLSHAQAGFQQVQRWVTEGSTDAAPTPAAIHVTGVSGVRITLRWLGLTMGTGDALADPLPERDLGPPVDLVPLLRTATQQALDACERTVRDARGKAAVSGRLPAEKDKQEDPKAQLARMVGQFQIDIQIARQLEPIVTARTDAGAVLGAVAPGYHGLFLTRHMADGSRRRAWLWPATAIAQNLSPQSQLNGLLAELGYPAAAMVVGKVNLVGGEGGDLSAARFTVIHVVRPTFGQPMTQLVRGNVVLPTISVDERTLTDMSQRLADHLLSRLRDDGSFTGTYYPSNDRFDPPTATHANAALAAYALGRYARSLPDSDPRRATASSGFARAIDRLRQDLPVDARSPLEATVEGDLEVEGDPAAKALLVLALVEGPFLAEPKADRDAFTAQLLTLRNEDGSFCSGAAATAPPLGAPTQALVVAALAKVYEQTRDRELGRLVNQSLTRVWSSTPEDRLPGTLPWLAIAELTMCRLDPTRHVGGLTALRDIAEQLRARQVKPPLSADRGPEDVVGGLALQRMGAGTIPLPDWRTAQMLAFLARALREPDLVRRQDTVPWLLDCGLAARFVGQLMITEPSCYYIRSPRTAMGGVRAALWDNRLNPSATAMALLGCIELRESMAAVSGAVAAPPTK